MSGFASIISVGAGLPGSGVDGMSPYVSVPKASCCDAYPVWEVFKSWVVVPL